VHTENGKRLSRPRTSGPAPISVRYPVIVPPELWHAAAQVINRGGAPRVRTDAATYLLYGGMVRCGEHDRIMTGTASSGNSDRRRYRCVRCGPMGRRTVHQVLSRPLDEAVWAEVLAFLADPQRGMEAARHLAEDAEQRMVDLAARQVGLQKQLEALDEEASELLRLARRRTIRQDRLDASMAEVEREQERVREEMETVRAQIAEAAADLPQAGELERACADLAAGRTYAEPQDRRDLLESLQIQVTMDGLDYAITGIVPELERRGSMAEAGRVQPSEAGSRLASSRPASPAGHHRRHTSRPGSSPRGGSVPGV
jgi:hypothetical protein